MLSKCSTFLWHTDHESPRLTMADLRPDAFAGAASFASTFVSSIGGYCAAIGRVLTQLQPSRGVPTAVASAHNSAALVSRSGLEAGGAGRGRKILDASRG